LDDRTRAGKIKKDEERKTWTDKLGTVGNILLAIGIALG
jgi:hypothetical protein